MEKKKHKIKKGRPDEFRDVTNRDLQEYLYITSKEGLFEQRLKKAYALKQLREV
ncbi:hypothetical protein AALA24_13615 [Anaerovoracaceae bacterium 42-11]